MALPFETHTHTDTLTHSHTHTHTHLAEDEDSVALPFEAGQEEVQHGELAYRYPNV
jgi:hypothetical protein